MRRFKAVVVAGLAALAGCHSDTTGPKTPDYAVGVYDEFSRDSQVVPYIVSQDTHCTTVNTGGWISLEAGGTYVLNLDQTEIMCDTARSAGGVAWVQRGTYVRNGNSITLTAAANDGGEVIAAVFDSGTYASGQGGRLPLLSFDDGLHQYALVNRGVAAVRAR